MSGSTRTEHARNSKSNSFFWRGLLLVIALSLSPISVLAQLRIPDEVPNSVTSTQHEQLTTKRTKLLQKRQNLLEGVQNHNQECSSVPKGSEIAHECAAAQQQLVSEIGDYEKAVEDFEQLVSGSQSGGPAAGLISNSCDSIARQVQMDREEIERQIRTNRFSQQELSDWARLSSKAQTAAVMAGVKFVMGEFVADIDPVRTSVSKLEREAAELAQKATNSKKSATRVRYLAQLTATLDQLEPMQGNLMDKLFVQTGDDADKVWTVARSTMLHEFRVARTSNEAMRDALREPSFKEAFTGDDIDTPGLEVLTVLAEQAGEEASKFLFGLEKYERFTGPTIRAAEFVRDASYSALLSYASAQRVTQQSNLAGDLAKSAGVLQERYKNSIDALEACRQVASSKR